MDRLVPKLKKSFKYKTLDYKYIARDFLSELDRDQRLAAEIDTNIRDFLLPLASSSFDYYKRHFEVFQKDKSLKAVTSLCNCEQLLLNVSAEDKTVRFLSHLFNQVIHSSRGLLRCYDCGTNARAMFFELIRAHRGQLYVSPQEQMKIQELYLPNPDAVNEVSRFHRFATTVQSDTVFICSLGLGDSGHVWVIEKRFIGPNRKVRYHMYQSCLNSHLVLDFIEHCDYAKKPCQSMDIDAFCSDLQKIMGHRGPWTESIKKLFAKRFLFLPANEVTDPSNTYCWAYLTY